jgi:hypothetical protein
VVIKPFGVRTSKSVNALLVGKKSKRLLTYPHRVTLEVPTAVVRDILVDLGDN